MDMVPHTVTVTSGPEKFDSGELREGRERVLHVHQSLDPSEYYCAVHPEITVSATVVGSEREPSEDPTDDPTDEPLSRGIP